MVSPYCVNTIVCSYQQSAGRPRIRTPIHDRLTARGAVFGEAHGYERPRWFALDGVAALRPGTTRVMLQP